MTQSLLRRPIFRIILFAIAISAAAASIATARTTGTARATATARTTGTARATANIPPATVKITAKIINTTPETPKVARFNFSNPFNKYSPSARFDARGRMSVSAEMLFSQNMTVQFNDDFIYLYVEPGDSLHLEIDAAKLKEPDFKWLKINGKHAKMSWDINLGLHFTSAMRSVKYDYSVAPEVLQKQIQEDFDSKKVIFRKFADSAKLSPEAIAFSESEMLFMISNQVSDYLIEANSDNYKERLKVFSSPLFDMYNAEHFNTMMFPYHLSFYGSILIDNDSEYQQLVKNGHPADAAARALAIFKNLPAGWSRDYMEFDLISRLADKYSEVLKRPDAVPAFANPIVTEYFNERFGSTALTFKETKLDNIKYLDDKGIVSTIKNKDIIQYVAEKYKGKVIYIDVYATWCGPCLAEMKFAPELHTSMKKADVVFVNICMESTEANWKKLVKEKPVIGENYFLGSDDTKMFRSNYDLGGYPSYLIVNKKGVVISNKAPRPSSGKELTDKLTELSAK